MLSIVAAPSWITGCASPVTHFMLVLYPMGNPGTWCAFLCAGHAWSVPLVAHGREGVAVACGADAVRVESTDEILPALSKAVDSGRPCLVEVRCHPHARPPITGWDGTPEPT
jgi:hypothetical protein